jgi:23S rRNA G2069 N7-methylase RlmK/C1962 C5-methylase RlmI
LKRQRMSGTMDALHDHPAPEAGTKWQNEKSRPEGRLFNTDQGSVITPAPQVCEIRKAGAAYRKRLTTTTLTRVAHRCATGGDTR